MYVAVKGGEKAIANAHALQENRRRGDETIAELSVAQIEQQMNLAVDRVMTEGGIADRELAALALKQASGASSRSAMPPSVITRSTARCSCWVICSMLSSGSRPSPRRLCSCKA